MKWLLVYRRPACFNKKINGRGEEDLNLRLPAPKTGGTWRKMACFFWTNLPNIKSVSWSFCDINQDGSILSKDNDIDGLK
jgi:hypothetical protein